MIAVSAPFRFKGGKQLRLGNHALCTPTKETDHDGTEWLVVEDTFFFVHCCNLPWVAHDAQMAPPARPADGLMTVVIMRPTTRLNAVRMFLAAESGGHPQVPQVEVFQCTGLKMEPDSSDGATTSAPQPALPARWPARPPARPFAHPHVPAASVPSSSLSSISQ